MRRWTARILICLILGAVTNFAIARWATYYAPMTEVASLPSGWFSMIAEQTRLDLRNRAIIDAVLTVDFGYTFTYFETADGWEVAEHRAGTPFRCFHGWVALNDGVEIHREGLETDGDYSLFILKPRYLPLVANVGVFGAIYFAPVAAIALARRVRRTKRGRCPRCGYDLRGDMNAGCPECGWGRPEITS